MIDGKYPLPENPTRQDLEVLAECVTRGYLLQKGADQDFSRTMDGIPHLAVDMSVVPVKGLAFLHPDRTRLKSTVALWVSISALAVSLLSNLNAIAQSISWLISVLAE